MGVVAEVFLPVALAFIMFGLGLGLTFDDFARVAKQPRDFLVGAASQLILLPIVAFILVSIWPLNPEIALGVMIIAAAPGGVTSNILTAFARGDVALSISLTAVISLVCVATIPLIVVFAHSQLIGGNVGDVSVAKTAISVFFIVTVPVLIGLLVRRFAQPFATRFEPWTNRMSTALFVIVLSRRNLPAAQQHHSLLCGSRICHACTKRFDDVAGLHCRQSIRLRHPSTGRNIDRMRASERHFGHSNFDVIVRGRSDIGPCGDLQPYNVLYRSDIYYYFTQGHLIRGDRVGVV